VKKRRVMQEQELIELLKEDPETGICEALRLYGGAVETICRNFLYDCQEMDIEEAVADTFLKLWKAKDRIGRHPRKGMKSYLYEIARNTARDKRRALKRASIYSLEEIELGLKAPLDIETDFIRKSNERILHECLDDTGEPDRSIFVMRYFYGEAIKDIALKLEMTPKSVENTLYRGKQRLEKALNERGIFRESY
jgi:RNA polymerase sigma-70 factor (ECF subfamily)